MDDHKLRVLLAAKDISAGALNKFKINIGAVVKSVFSLRGAIGTLAGTGGMGYLVKSSLNAADAIGKAADVAALHTSTLQEYHHAAKLSGVSTDLLNSSFLAFNKRLGEAQAGTGPLVSYLNKVDKQFLDMVTSAGSTDKALKLIFDRMGELTNEADRAALANAAFSRSGVKLTVMTKNGAAGLNAMIKEARDLGLVIEDHLIRGAEAANDKLDTLARVIKIQFTNAVLELAPKISEISAGMLNWVKANQEFLKQDVPNYLSEIATALGSIAKYAGLRSIYETYTQGLDLANKGAIDFNEFVKASFIARQKMVDDALAALRTLTIEGNKITGKITGQPAPGGGGPGTTAGSTPAAGLPAARWSPRSDRGPWAPRAGGMVGLEDMAKKHGAAYEKMDAHVIAWRDQTVSAYGHIEQSVDTFASHSTDALAGFVSKSKLDFKSLADSLIADLIRIKAKMVVTGLFSSIGSYFGSGATGPGYRMLPGGGQSAGFRAAGGPVTAGKPYIVGEGGRPELFIPGQSGTIVTASKASVAKAAPATQVIINNHSGQPASVKESTDPDGLRRLIVDIAASDVVAGGRLAQSFGQTFNMARSGRI